MFAPPLTLEQTRTTDCESQNEHLISILSNEILVRKLQILQALNFGFDDFLRFLTAEIYQ